MHLWQRNAFFNRKDAKKETKIEKLRNGVLRDTIWWFNFLWLSYYSSKGKEGLTSPWPLLRKSICDTNTREQTASSTSHQKCLILTAYTQTKFKSAVLNTCTQTHAHSPHSINNKKHLISFTCLPANWVCLPCRSATPHPPATHTHTLIWTDPIQQQQSGKLVCIYIYRII